MKINNFLDYSLDNMNYKIERIDFDENEQQMSYVALLGINHSLIVKLKKYSYKD